MEQISRDRFWRLIAVALVAGLYLFGYAIISSGNNRLGLSTSIFPMAEVALPSLEAGPHVEWKLSPEIDTPQEVLNFINARGLHNFQILTDVHQGGWHFHVVYEEG